MPRLLRTTARGTGPLHHLYDPESFLGTRMLIDARIGDARRAVLGLGEQPKGVDDLWDAAGVAVSLPIGDWWVASEALLAALFMFLEPDPQTCLLLGLGRELWRWVSFGNTREERLEQVLSPALVNPAAAIIFSPAYIYVFIWRVFHIPVIGSSMPLTVFPTDPADGKGMIPIPLLGIGIGVLAGMVPDIYSVMVLVVGARLPVFLPWRMVLQAQIFRSSLDGWMEPVRMVG